MPIHKKLYHVGFRGSIAKNTWPEPTKTATGESTPIFAQVLIAHARRLYAADGFGVELEQTTYALDSTTIDLCLALFPWARFRRRKGAVKLHTLVDLRGNIPCFVRITHGKTHDVTALDTVAIEAGAFYVMDRGYLDFGRLHRFTLGSGVLRDPGQEEPRLQPAIVSTGRQDDGAAQRSNDYSERPQVLQALSRAPAADRLLRPGDQASDSSF